VRRGLALLLLLGGCSPPKDTFVGGVGEIARWEETSDGHVRIPLVAGLAWDPPQPAAGALLRVAAREGPTVVLVTVVPDAPTPRALGTCAAAHASRIAVAASKGGVAMTSPVVDDDIRKGKHVPRVHYAVPLDVKDGARPASLMSSWTYVLVGDRCLALGVSAVVRAKIDDAGAPDPEDLHRLERVFSAIAEGVETK